MADRPITFSGPMVRALLAGTKTQTRRLLPHSDGLEAVDRQPNGGWVFKYRLHYQPEVDGYAKAPRIAAGDRLYVREHWRTVPGIDDMAPRDMIAHLMPIAYVADDGPTESLAILAARGGKFRQAMHMPKWASRITLHVGEVRVQRLMDISDADCLAEGVQPYAGGGFTVPNICVTDGPRSAYFTLLDHLHGQGFSAKNPWVTATSFSVEKINIDQARAA